MGFPGVKNLPSSAEDVRFGFSPEVGKIPWRREWLPTPGFFPGESHRQRSLRQRVKHNWSDFIHTRIFLWASLGAQTETIWQKGKSQGLGSWNLALWVKSHVASVTLRLLVSISIRWGCVRHFYVTPYTLLPTPYSITPGENSWAQCPPALTRDKGSHSGQTWVRVSLASLQMVPTGYTQAGINGRSVAVTSPDWWEDGSWWTNIPLFCSPSRQILAAFPEPFQKAPWNHTQMTLYWFSLLPVFPSPILSAFKGPQAKAEDKKECF